MTKLNQPPDQNQPNGAANSNAGGGNALGLSAEELHRRRMLVARAGADEATRAALDAAQRQAVIAARVARAREAAEAAERERPRPRMTNDFDPGPPKARWAREAELAAAVSQGAGRPSEDLHLAKPRRVRFRERKARPWKSPRRKSVEPSARVLAFAAERGWTRARSQALATRIKQNDAIIAHPRAAEAALRKLSSWSQASVRRALRAMGWNFGDDAARRHVALWSALEDFARPRAYSRPRRSSAGPSRFCGTARYSLCVVGWTQTALALAISGAACTDGHADPVDNKTVQRHAELAAKHGALSITVRNPLAEPELRGLPCASNPRGWPINEYWLPAPYMHKPAFAGAHFDADGNPIGLDEALAIELPPHLKSGRCRPPPLASPVTARS